MAYPKPPQISEEEWAKTPPAVQALLAQYVTHEQTKETQTQTDPDEGSTISMPLAPQPDDDGATMNMRRRDTLPDDDDGSTMTMPGGQFDSPMDEGSTINMPRPDAPPADGDPMAVSPGEDDGATANMSPAASADDGSTRAMPQDNDRNTRAMPSPHEMQPAVALTPMPADELAGDIILQGRYQLQKILGKGGFGAAYLAEDIKLRRGCVVKQMLNPHNITARKLEQNRADFEREANLLVKLNHPGHPNIPEIFDYFSDDSGSYLVMKYIEGRSLKDVVDKKSGKISWQEAVHHIIDVCSALNYMHSQGVEPVMHRDIKPANILLGNDGRIWLVDFGLAKVNPIHDTASEITNADASGSVGYTPFEQWLGQAEPASDVYAVGVTLHHLVSGVDPLDAYREEGQLKVNIEKLKSRHGHLNPVRKIDRTLPEELEEIIAGATAAEPDQRPTALQLQNQLEVLVSGAKDAALFTFKNGLSAKTIAELVDLCETNRIEAQGYLYRGDFARWFTLINRNELAEAAKQAVKQGKNERQGLEKFLRLIMPNLFLRRLGKAAGRLGRVAALSLIIAMAVLLMVGMSGALATRWVLQRAIAGNDWDYYALDLDKENVFSESYLAERAENAARSIFDEVRVDAQAPNRVDVQANLGGVVWFNVPVELEVADGKPRVTLARANGVPLYWVGDQLSAGINQGISQAHQNAPIDITSFEVNDEAVIFNIAKSGRVAYAPPTPAPAATPTPLPTSTPTPVGQALLAIFNDLDQDVTLEIEGQSWLIPAHDTKVIEQQPGTYSYTVRYVANGQLAAQGSKTWDYRAYKWRIGLAGVTFE
jgi:tRNA A-37 threonylcarbamoyl transferase component Bud32